MSEQNRISTNKAPKPVGLYPHARRVGNLLFLSGVGPRVAGSDDTDSAVPGLKLDKNGPLFYLTIDTANKRIKNEIKPGKEEDKKPEVVQNRLAVYHKQTKPLTTWYQSKNYHGNAKYLQISGLQSAKLISQEILKALHL